MRVDDTLLDLPMAAAGVVVFAFNRLGHRGAGAYPFAPARRAVGVTMANLYLGLVGFFTYSLATRSVLARPVALGFLALLALAPWQKLVTAVIGAPLFEEIIFRGMMYKALHRRWPAWASALASAGAFAACHPPPAMLLVFLVGVGAAALVEWSAWVAPAMLLHTAYNASILSGVWEHLLRPLH
jgi:membrane protease YdiL (CAAX protease family)